MWTREERQAKREKAEKEKVEKEKAEKQKEKTDEKGEDKDKKEKEKAKGPSQSSPSPVPSPSTPLSHQRYELHRDIFAMRQGIHRKRKQAVQAKEIAPRLPAAPRNLPSDESSGPA